MRRLVRPFKRNKVGRNFCRPGSNCRRGHAPVRGGAAAHAGASRVARAADGNVGGASGHLKVSPGDLEPVFASMLENAVRICDAKFGNIYRWDGDALHLVASHNVPPAFADSRRRSALLIHRAARALGRSPAAHIKRQQRVRPLAHRPRQLSTSLPWCDQGRSLGPSRPRL
jgi:hypothetical protein